MRKLLNILQYGFLSLVIVFVASPLALGNVSKSTRKFIKEIKVGTIGGNAPTVTYQEIDKDVIKVSISTLLTEDVHQDDWQVNIAPAFQADFHWAPHLTPTAEHIIAQHVFRAPALIMAGEGKQIKVIPDLDLLQKKPEVDWYMDMDAPANCLTLGMSQSQVREHVLYTRKPGAVYPAGKIIFSFFILTDDDKINLENPWRKALAFFWEKWGATLYKVGEPLRNKEANSYVKHVYNWAFVNWKEQVWQEFRLGNKNVGAPTFIVNVTQSLDYPGEPTEREFRSIWNQAWFSSLRSAQGLYRYARRFRNDTLLRYALMTKELALSFPQTKGFFPRLIAAEMKTNIQRGQHFNYFIEKN